MSKRSATVTPTGPQGSGPAIRNKRPSWRDPRIIAGIVLIAASVLIGAKLMASLDDTVGVWALRTDLSKGSKIADSELTVTQIRFTDAATADLYVSADDEIASDTSINRDLQAGELLPRSAIDAEPRQELIEVPISVESANLPATVRQGSTVDVWVTSKSAGASRPDTAATLVLPEALVIAVPTRSDSFAPESSKQVILGVPAKDSQELADALGVMSEGSIVITRRR